MITLRCTQKLLRQLRVSPAPDVSQPTNRLGDWYAHALNIGRVRLVLCVSERSLLPVILPAREYRTLVSRLLPEVEWILKQLGVSSESREAEVTAMEPMAIGRTRSRVVLGSMNEMQFEAWHRLTDSNGLADLRLTSLRLCDSIYSQLGRGRREYASPREATMGALGGESTATP